MQERMIPQASDQFNSLFRCSGRALSIPVSLLAEIRSGDFQHIK